MKELSRYIIYTYTLVCVCERDKKLITYNFLTDLSNCVILLTRYFYFVVLYVMSKRIDSAIMLSFNSR